MRAMTKAAWNPRNADDLAIFRALREHFQYGGRPQRPRDLDLAFGATATDEDKNDDGDAPYRERLRRKDERRSRRSAATRWWPPASYGRRRRSSEKAKKLNW